MKVLTALVCFTLISSSAFAQGLIKFANRSTTLISANGEAASGTFYYALLAAAPGTTDRTSFQFTGLYATNTATAGRLQGGSLLGVTANSAWPALTERSFFVAGWSASFGTTWNQSWLTDFGNLSGWFGASPIATGTSGGVDPVTGQTVPALALWSGTTLTTGFNLGPVPWPEPASASLLIFGALTVVLFRRRRF